jgi:hypothetical protein
MVEGSHDEVMQLTPPGDKIDPRYQSGSGNHITTPSQAPTTLNLASRAGELPGQL